MDQVTLPGGPRLSRLGFGCAALMARIDRPRSLRLLQSAHAAGITHFDVARSYGYGEAEVALGDLIAAVGRDRLTIATKFGILPPRRSRLLSAAKAAARLAAGLHPGLRRLLRRGATGLVTNGAFDIPAATASLEASLRALRTDHVDLLLLHECRPADLTEELLRFLEAAGRDGKILHHGIATLPEDSVAILRDHAAFASVVQCAGSLWSPPPAAPALIVHSALGPGFAAFATRLTAEPALAAAWSAAAGFDVRQDLPRLAGLCLAATNPAGVVLFSSTNPRNIAANAALAGRAGDHAALRALAAATARPPA